MTPTQFAGQNAIFAKDQPEYLPLPALVVPGPEGAVISCWELTDEEVEELVRTKRLYISQWCFTKVVDGEEKINPLQPIRPALSLADYFQPQEQ